MRTLAGLGDAPAILMYHRVADVEFDPWGLAVTPRNFRAQVQSLGEARTVLPMDDLVARLQAGDCPPRATALTFDDGYSDNALNALPVLEALSLPATIFVTVDGSRSGQTFWWDDLADIVSRTPEKRISLKAGGVCAEAQWSDDPPSMHLAYMRLWNELRALPAKLRNSAIAAAKASMESSRAADLSSRPLSIGDLRRIASGDIRIGGHGCDHASLTTLPVEERKAQIRQSRELVAEWTGQSQSGFAYPHGEWDLATREIVEDSGYNWAVSTRHGVVDLRHFDRFALPRIKVNNCAGPLLLKDINNAPLAH